MVSSVALLAPLISEIGRHLNGHLRRRIARLCMNNFRLDDVWVRTTWSWVHIIYTLVLRCPVPFRLNHPHGAACVVQYSPPILPPRVYFNLLCASLGDCLRIRGRQVLRGKMTKYTPGRGRHFGRSLWDVAAGYMEASSAAQELRM